MNEPFAFRTGASVPEYKYVITVHLTINARIIHPNQISLNMINSTVAVALLVHPVAS